MLSSVFYRQEKETLQWANVLRVSVNFIGG